GRVERYGNLQHFPDSIRGVFQHRGIYIQPPLPPIFDQRLYVLFTIYRTTDGNGPFILSHLPEQLVQDYIRDKYKGVDSDYFQFCLKFVQCYLTLFVLKTPCLSFAKRQSFFLQCFSKPWDGTWPHTVQIQNIIFTELGKFV